MDPYDLATSPNELPVLPYNQGLPLSIARISTSALFPIDSETRHSPPDNLLKNHKFFGLNSSCEDLDMSSSIEEVEILDYPLSPTHEQIEKRNTEAFL
jgi:hypothetical protein